MKNKALGLIYTGDANPYMRDLTAVRAVTAIPFGGNFRIIDFLLASMINSGMTDIGVIAQRNYHSLMDHLGTGKDWDLDRKRGGLTLLPPFLSPDATGVYRGSVDALRAVMGFVRDCPEKYVVYSGSHTVFNIDINEIIKYHEEKGADITIMYNHEAKRDNDEVNKDQRLTVDSTGRIAAIELDPYRPKTDCRSCDLMIMDKNLLEYLVEEAYSRGDMDFWRDVLMKRCDTLRMYGWEYNGVVMRIDSVSSYYDCSMKLLGESTWHGLLDRPVYTKQKDEFCTHYSKEADVRDSIVAEGCNISGSVEHSVIFRGVNIGRGAVVKNCIVMQGTTIGEGCQLDHVIVDKDCTIRDGRVLAGYDGFPICLKKGQTV